MGTLTKKTVETAAHSILFAAGAESVLLDHDHARNEVAVTAVVCGVGYRLSIDASELDPKALALALNTLAHKVKQHKMAFGAGFRPPALEEPLTPADRRAVERQIRDGDALCDRDSKLPPPVPDQSAPWWPDDACGECGSRADCEHGERSARPAGIALEERTNVILGEPAVSYAAPGSMLVAGLCAEFADMYKKSYDRTRERIIDSPPIWADGTVWAELKVGSPAYVNGRGEATASPIVGNTKCMFVGTVAAVRADGEVTVSMDGAVKGAYMNFKVAP